MGRLLRSRAAAAALVLALVLAGAAALLARRTGPTRVRAHVLNLTMTDYRFHPQRVVVAPGPLTVVLRDAGRLPHAFRLLRSGREVARRRTIRPGATDTFVRVVRPGTYRFLCPLQNHAELGMYGSLEVR